MKRETITFEHNVWHVFCMRCTQLPDNESKIHFDGWYSYIHCNWDFWNCQVYRMNHWIIRLLNFITFGKGAERLGLITLSIFNNVTYIRRCFIRLVSIENSIKFPRSLGIVFIKNVVHTQLCKFLLRLEWWCKETDPRQESRPPAPK